MQFNELLNDYVSRMGISYKALAQEAGMTAGVISRYKNGSRLPSVKTGAARKLAEAVASLAVQNGMELTADEVEAEFMESLKQEKAAPKAESKPDTAAVKAEPKTPSGPAQKPSSGNVPEPSAPALSNQDKKRPARADGVIKYRHAKGIRKAEIEFYESVMKDPDIKRMFIYQAMPKPLDRNYLTEIMAGGVNVFLAVHLPINLLGVIRSFIEWWPLYRSGRLHLYLARGSRNSSIFGKGMFYTKKTALTVDCMGGDLYYGKALRIKEGRRLAAIKRRMAFVFKLSKRII